MSQSSHAPVDRFAALLANAPLDDEPVTAEEREELAVARQEAALDETFSTDELRRELGL